MILCIDVSINDKFLYFFSHKIRKKINSKLSSSLNKKRKKKKKKHTIWYHASKDNVPALLKWPDEGFDFHLQNRYERNIVGEDSLMMIFVSLREFNARIILV